MKPVYTEQPKLAFMPTSDTPHWLHEVIQGILRFLGLGLLIQTNRGNQIPFRFNEDTGKFEVFINGEWRVR